MNWSVKVRSLRTFSKSGILISYPGLTIVSFYCISIHPDFTRLKLVQSKKEVLVKEQMEEAALQKKAEAMAALNDEDITAQYDAQDDEDIVF